MDPRKRHQSLPKLAFLQGGPGGKGPRPQGGGPVWLAEALKTHRVILMDQRGTGRSSRVESATLASMDGQARAAYLWHFRADSIVHDCEFLRTALFGGDRWETLGQSYGGFLTLTYLSLWRPKVCPPAMLPAGCPASMRMPMRFTGALTRGWRRKTRATTTVILPTRRASPVWRTLSPVATCGCRMAIT
ncbi:alpha/beta fold hydrolase [Candidatus Sodalis pierantonius]|uniref:alpha/beta fold hydrolase n=1 Tax=Candidatus Sodalis pierantonii TaxID=1486991 RepID=UPI001F46A217|nr:alpha/beta fold hydrolase [Candidatus Sodalis pierantonius]